MSRAGERSVDSLREIVLEPGCSLHAEGSCMVWFGRTQVLCMASWQHGVPSWLRGQGKGWLTAEYGMLPRATHTRNRREVMRGHPSGRTQEIQRLIGRSLRAVTDLRKLGENQIVIDCDVLQADGGTRTAAITGGWVALSLAIRHLLEKRRLERSPLTGQVAAVSCGLCKGSSLLDLDYAEDSGADVDANFVMTGDGGLIEIQVTGEQRAFSREEFNSLSSLADKGCEELFSLQRQALSRQS